MSPKVKTSKRGRKTPMTQAEKDKAAEARRVTNEQRKAGLEVLETNQQFTNPKFWNRVDDNLLLAVKEAVDAAAEKAKNREIEALEAKLAALKDNETAE